MTRPLFRCAIGWICAVVSLVLFSSGCATKSYVNRGLTETNERLDTVSSEVEENQRRILTVEETTANNRQAIEHTQGELVGLKQETENLKRGKLLFETTFSTDDMHFAVGSAALSDEGKALLDEFAERIKSQNRGVWIEIEGHTDSTGSEQYNFKLGLERAEAVKAYLVAQHGIPLHRISTISYGETRPVASNDDEEGRRRNRRVVLRVLE